MDFSGKTVIITGASRGIGEAAARLFAENGARVALLARSAHDVSRIASEIGSAAMAVACDVADYAQVENAFSQVFERFGGCDVLINNAGVIEPIATLRDSDPVAWGQAIDINLKGVYHGMRAVLPYMRGGAGGSVLTISSGAAHGAMEGWSHYCASKAGVHMMTQALHKEEGGAGVRAIGLSPGTVATKMQREIKSSGINPVAALEWEDHIPAEWPARALMWMCTADSDEFLGREVSLRDEGVRQRIGLSE